MLVADNWDPQSRSGRLVGHIGLAVALTSGGSP